MENAWAEEKRALLATIQRQEQDAAKLARRFKLLQRTLVEQQALLDRYQRALRQSVPSGEAVGEGSQATVRTAEQLGETKSTGEGLAVDASVVMGVSGEAVGEPDAVVRSREETEGIPHDRPEAEDVETQHHETATCLSPPMVAIEAPPALFLPALDDVAADAKASVTAATVPAAIGSCAVPTTEPAPSATKLKEATTTTSEAASNGGSLWTRRRKPDLRGDARASTNVVVVPDPVALPSTPGLPPIPSASTSLATTKRPRPAPAKWADVKKQRAVFAPSTGPTAVAARASDKENREFAHVEVVRNRDARAALPAHDCVECARYYAALGDMVSAEQVAEHKRTCSRHRARFQPYETPDDFWRLSFPDSEPTT